MKIRDILTEADTLKLPTLKVGDEVKVGKFKNRKAEITGFEKDEHNHPVMKTTKGDQKVFKNRHSKIEEANDGNTDEVFHFGNKSWNVKRGYQLVKKHNIQPEMLPVEGGLASFLGFMRVNKDWAKSTDLSAPVLLIDTGKGVLVIDGYHRIKRAKDEGVKELPGYILSTEMSKEIEILDEASYAGNIGIMELIKFKKVATPAIKALVDNLIGQGRNREAWKIIQKQTRTKLKGKQFEQDLSEITMDPRTGKGALRKGELDEFIDRAYPVGKVKGYEIRLFDEDEPEEFHYLIKDPDSESFLGYMSFIKGSRDNFYRSNVFFYPSIQGKGLGVALYAFGIKHSGQTLVSDSTQTKGSQTLWKRLSQHPDINVYGWDVDKNEFFHWNPDEDDDSDVWRDSEHESNQIAMLRKKMVALQNDLEDGKISQQDFDQLTKQYKDEAEEIQNQGQNWRNDIRLVATTK